MATHWSLDITGTPTDADLEHIAKLIKEGFTSGQLVEEDNDSSLSR